MSDVFHVGDRVRICDGEASSELVGTYGTVVYIHNDGGLYDDVLVRHDTYHRRMHNGGGRVQEGYGWWYYDPSYLEIVRPPFVISDEAIEEVL